MHLRLLRTCLGLVAVTWGVSLVGAVVPWSVAASLLRGAGMQSLAYDPMLDYWLRMAAGAFGLLGAWYAVLLRWPQRYHRVLPWFGALTLLEGLILLVHGLRLGLPPFPFYIDTATCLVGGVGILVLARHARPAAADPQPAEVVAPTAGRGHERLLRLFLGLAALTWGVAGVGVLLRWDTAVAALAGLGAPPLAYDRMLDYWLRMAAGAYGLLGAWYAVLLVWPRRFHATIPWFGGLMLAEGVILLVHGLRLGLPPFPFYSDTAACLVGGGAIVYLARAAYPTVPARR